MKRKTLYWTLGLTIVGLLALAKMLSGPPESNPEQNSASAVSDKWRMSQSRSPMDDSVTVSAALDSEDKINGPVETTRPTLIIRCKEKKTEVYVVTGMPASIETYFSGEMKNYHTVRIRLDQGEAFQTAWVESDDHKALFLFSLSIAPFTYHDEIPFAKQLAGASTLTMEFTPFDSTPTIVRFDLRGGKDHLGKVGEACGWSLE